MSTALARRTDPDTSHDAAADVRRRRTIVRDCVLAIMREAPEPLTHERIVGRFRQRAGTRIGWPAATDSSVRTRVHELVRDGLVERVPGAHGTSTTGRRAALWRATTDA
ncbi:hypothetical protein [Isoptericola dokdonensis]|uniref:Uncharacterized protein n=1 Tax=Isoptericola dokdonensis DS-3 TaxID=1300344 RepID=A0A161I214_9MICO|nr:hypothetical protein [Isoptericola dokdonensis]ANC31465.1 hypothetical protein I598_1917 [Isoptericola dokdonensis DS-3]